MRRSESTRYSDRRPGRGAAKGNRLLQAIVVACFAVLAAFIAYILIVAPPAIDPVTGCPTEAGHTRRSVFFLLDSTDRLSATQQQLIKNVFYQVVAAAEGYDRLEIFEVDPATDQLLVPIFNFCKPVFSSVGSPIEERFRESRFKDDLQRVFDGVVYDRPESPIMGSIGSVASLYPNDGSRRHLLIASDFVENSDLMNQYRNNWRDVLRNDTKRLYDRAPRLEGVSLSMLFIPRPSVPHQDQDFRDWWLEFLEESGGRFTEQIFHDPATDTTYVLDPFIPITG